MDCRAGWVNRAVLLTALDVLLYRLAGLRQYCQQETSTVMGLQYSKPYEESSSEPTVCNGLCLARHGIEHLVGQKVAWHESTRCTSPNHALQMFAFLQPWCSSASSTKDGAWCGAVFPGCRWRDPWHRVRGTWSCTCSPTYPDLATVYILIVSRTFRTVYNVTNSAWGVVSRNALCESPCPCAPLSPTVCWAARPPTASDIGSHARPIIALQLQRTIHASV